MLFTKLSFYVYLGQQSDQPEQPAQPYESPQPAWAREHDDGTCCVIQPGPRTTHASRGPSYAGAAATPHSAQTRP